MFCIHPYIRRDPSLKKNDGEVDFEVVVTRTEISTQIKNIVQVSIPDNSRMPKLQSYGHLREIDEEHFHSAANFVADQFLSSRNADIGNK